MMFPFPTKDKINLIENICTIAEIKIYQGYFAKMIKLGSS